jgi:hypothetical protein
MAGGDISTDCASASITRSPRTKAEETGARSLGACAEVLARLLELNRQRAEAERAAKLTGQAPPPQKRAPKAPKPTPKAKPKAKPAPPPGLFEPRDDG